MRERRDLPARIRPRRRKAPPYLPAVILSILALLPAGAEIVGSKVDSPAEKLPAATVNINPDTFGQLIPVGQLHPIRLEAAYNEPLTLKDALRYAMSENLDIKISKENYRLQLYTLYANIASFLPSNTLAYDLTVSNVTPNPTISRGRFFSASPYFRLFQGGSYVYNTLGSYYRAQGWKKGVTTFINDTLLDVFKKYTDLQQKTALVQIRSRSVDFLDAQLTLSQKLFKAGKGTRLGVIESQAELDSEREELLRKQFDLRNASMELSYSLNKSLAINIIPASDNITEFALLNESFEPEELIRLAMKQRPELQQLQYFILNDKRTINAEAASLYPTLGAGVSYSHSSTTTSGQENVAGAGVFSGLFNTVEESFSGNYTLAGLGITSAMNINSARTLARADELRREQRMLKYAKDIRSAYLSVLSAHQEVQTSSALAQSYQEALRLTQARFRALLDSTPQDSLDMHRKYVTALEGQVNAIVASNNAQAQLLHDVGFISIDNLTADRHPFSWQKIK